MQLQIVESTSHRSARAPQSSAALLSPHALYYSLWSLFFHQTAPQLNIEKSYVGPMSRNDHPCEGLTIVPPFYKHVFALLSTVNPPARLLERPNTSCDCRSIMIAPHEIELLPRLLRPYIELFIATKLSLGRRRQVEASRIRCLEAPAGCLDSTVSHKRRI